MTCIRSRLLCRRDWFAPQYGQSQAQRFIEHFDETEESLHHLHAPVGIYIGSKTPAEIAASVIAEVLAVKNGVALPCTLSVAKAKAKAKLELPAER